MDAKKCDRCGKIYGNLDKSEVLNKMINFTPSSFSFRKRDSELGCTGTILIFECCPECMEEIYMFVKKSHK